LPRIHKTKQDLYLDQVFGSEDSLLQKIRALSDKEQVSFMQITPHEGGLLYFLAKSIKANKIVEIGSLYCHSTIYLARALHSDKGLVFTCDRSTKRHQLSQDQIKPYPEYDKIRWITGPALDTLPSLENQGPFDMVFIDADKESYDKYLTWSEKNLKTNGLLVADNTFLFGSVYGETDQQPPIKTIETIRRFNQHLAQSSHWISTLIPTKEGMTVALKTS